MSGGPRRARRYCTNCGAEARTDDAFCVSCGASVEPGLEAQEGSGVGPESLRPSLRNLQGAFEGLVRRLSALPRPSGVVVGLMVLASLMVLLLALFPLISPLVETLEPVGFLATLSLFALSILALLLEVGRESQRRKLRRLALISMAAYFFIAAYHMLLMVLGFIEGGPPAWGLLVLVLGSGLVYAAFVVRNRSRNALPGRSALVGNWRGRLDGVAHWVGSLPLAAKAAVIVGVLGLLSLLSPYVFVLGAVTAVASVVALVVRAIQRRPLKQAVVAASSFVVFTVVFGVASDGLYGTGTGLTVSITSGDRGSRPTERITVDDTYTPILQDAVFTPGFAGEECAAVVDCHLIKRITVYGDYAEVILFDVKNPTMFEGAENDLICSGVADVAAQEGVPISRVVVKSRVVRRAAPDYGVRSECGAGESTTALRSGEYTAYQAHRAPVSARVRWTDPCLT